MADNEDVAKENTSRGNEWEVVSLTASAYAAAPAPVPKEAESKHGAYRDDDSEMSRALFMSGHFVFPPSEHENLPIEPETSEIQTDHADKDFLSDSGKQGLNVPEGFDEAQVFDSKGNVSEFEEETNLQGLITDREQSISAFHEGEGIDEQIDSSEQSLGYALNTEESSEPDEECKYVEAGLPCGAWWKRSATLLYDSNSFWSVFVAATVLGLVIIGQRYQQERWQALQLKWHVTTSSEGYRPCVRNVAWGSLCFSELHLMVIGPSEPTWPFLARKMGKMLGPLSRLKDVIVGAHGHRQALKYGSET
ncbi:hypothetical protein ACFE04_017640 [Oxalis oulophora]